MYPLLFLDVDGVLNCHEFDPEVMCGQIHPDKVDRLNTILRATEARIVLSSAWRYILFRGEFNLMGLEWLLRSHRVLADWLVGHTREDTLVVQPADYRGEPRIWTLTNERGQQIADYLDTVQHRGRYVVLDDLDLGISAMGHPFVQTNSTVGLTDLDMRQAIRLLKMGDSNI